MLRRSMSLKLHFFDQTWILSQYRAYGKNIDIEPIMSSRWKEDIRSVGLCNDVRLHLGSFEE